jgi:hypothetical protein
LGLSFVNYSLATTDLKCPLCSFLNRNYLFKLLTSIVSRSKICNSPRLNLDKTFKISHPIPPTPTKRTFILFKKSVNSFPNNFLEILPYIFFSK